MENHPDVVIAICKTLPCRNRNALVRCRDPFALQSIVSESSELLDLGVAFPLTTREKPTNAENGEWLSKQTDRSGGLGVQAWTAASRVENTSQVCYQQRVQGELVSGLYLGDGRNAVVLGVCQQWAGRSELGCAEFVYCGSIAPCVLSQSKSDAVAAAGSILTSEFGLCGVFGIDFILGAKGLWLLEINPRITASAEVCQKSLRLNIVEEHVRALAGAEYNLNGLPLYENLPSPNQFFGKATVFNRQSHSIVISTDVHRQLLDWIELGLSPSKTASSLGDVPMPNSMVGPGSPVLTVMVSARKKSAVEAGLLQLADEVYQMIDS